MGNKFFSGPGCFCADIEFYRGIEVMCLIRNKLKGHKLSLEQW